MPLSILIHTVEYGEYTDSGRYGAGYKEPLTLSNVLIQPVSSIKRTSYSNEVAYNSLMFFDCVNSKPSDVNFVKGSKITFNGEVMKVNKINPIYAFGLHHYEIELI